jgi:hypothetical protein
MWLFTKDGFLGLTRHPEKPDQLVVQTQTAGEMERFVRLLDEVGGHPHEIVPVSDGFSRFATVVEKAVAARFIARLVADIDYTSFTQASRFDFGADPQFILWLNGGGLQVARVKPE